MKKLFGIFLFLIFLPLATAVIFMLTLKFALLNPAFLKSALERGNFYENVISNSGYIVDATFANQKDSQNFPFTAIEAQNIVAQAVPPAWLKAEVEKNIDGAVLWFGKSKEELAIDLNLELVKPAVLQAVLKLSEEKFNALSVCNSKQLKNFGKENKFPECKPKGYTYTKFKTEFLESTNSPLEFLDKIPENVSLLPGGTLGQEGGFAQIKRMRDFVALAGNLLWGLAVISMLVFLSAALLLRPRLRGSNQPKPHSLLPTFAILGVVLGVFLTVFGFALKIIVKPLVFEPILENTKGISPEFLRAVGDPVVNALLAGFGNRIWLISALIGVASFGILIAGKLIARKA